MVDGEGRWNTGSKGFELLRLSEDVENGFLKYREGILSSFRTGWVGWAEEEELALLF